MHMEGEKMDEGSRRGKVDVERDIISFLNKIKSHSDEAVSVIDKAGESVADDSNKVFELTELIQQELEEIRELVYEIDQI